MFVTLKKNGSLRGCIGSVEAKDPLYQGVIKQSINASTEDYRFSPVTPQELDSIQIEITVLSPPKAVLSYTDIEIGRHGIILQKKKNGALFLPQVATEQQWDLETTLNHLAQKAGLNSHDWQRDTQFWGFEGLEFYE